MILTNYVSLKSGSILAKYGAQPYFERSRKCENML